MPVQQRSIKGKVDLQVELLLNELVGAVNGLEPAAGSAKRIHALQQATFDLQSQLAIATRELQILRALVTAGEASGGGGGGSGITQLTGDGTAGPGSGSQAFTLANSGVSAGSYGAPRITVDAKGRLTAAETGAASAEVITDQATASTTYTDLATVGPAVTLVTGASVIVWMTAFTYKPAGSGNTALISVAVSGATTLAANDANLAAAASPGASLGFTLAGILPLMGLTPGSNTFTVKYRVDGSTFNFAHRKIAVLAL